MSQLPCECAAPYRRWMATLLVTIAVASAAQAPPPRPRTFHLLEARIADVHAALQSRQITCRELVGLYLKRIQAYDKSGPGLNAIQTMNPRADRKSVV